MTTFGINNKRKKRFTKEDINSSEYKEVYNSGLLTNYDQKTDTYIAPMLDEAVVKSNIEYNPVGWKLSNNRSKLGYKLAPVIAGIGSLGLGSAISGGLQTSSNGISKGLDILSKASFQGNYGVKPWTIVADGLSSAIPTGLAANDMYNNGINATNSIELGLGLVPLVGPTVRAANNTIDAAKLTRKLVTGDEYTTIGGRFGYYGNPIERFWGTLARNKNLPDRARLPELMRKQDVIPHKEGKRFKVTFDKNNNLRFTNFTTDRPVVSHSKGNWDDKDLYIFDPEILQGHTPKSIEPSDTFFHGDELFSLPRQMTVVSGNKSILNQAQKEGSSTLSSRKLRLLWADMLDQYINNLEYIKLLPTIDLRLARKDFKSLVNPLLRKLYADEILRLLSLRGTPTILDYKLYQKLTGLSPGIASINYKKSLYNKLNKPLVELSGIFDDVEYNFDLVLKSYYPNRRLVNQKQFLGTEKDLIEKAPYNKVFYDPATFSEALYRSKLNVKRR